jgi:hypothetical protein
MEIVDALPLSAAGKVLEHELRRPHWVGYERVIHWPASPSDSHFRLSMVSAEAASRSHSGSKVMFTAEA